MIHELDAVLGTMFRIPSIERLNDGSWEILIRVTYVPLLRQILIHLYRSFTLDEKYQPIDPRPQDVAYFGRRRAEALHAIWFRNRAQRVTEQGGARAYYAQVLKQARWMIVWRICREGLSFRGDRLPPRADEGGLPACLPAGAGLLGV